ncbi:MAG: hypothetical protein DSM106950_25015 [Stigonema ocellatum SAG 48.90 = DSM 106950]|nr:hypothetical protein [Stigonema ocellatum SAG 48.90 = DSM 106950]
MGSGEWCDDLFVVVLSPHEESGASISTSKSYQGCYWLMSFCLADFV